MQARLQRSLLHLLVFLKSPREDLEKQILEKLHVLVILGNINPECAVEAAPMLDPGIFEDLHGQGSLPQPSHPYDPDHQSPLFPLRVEEMQNSFLLTFHEDDMGGVRGVKSGGPPPRNRRVDAPPFPPIMGESCDSVSRCALPELIILCLICSNSPKLWRRIGARGLNLLKKSRSVPGLDPWMAKDLVRSSASCACSLTSFTQFWTNLLASRALQEALRPCEISLKIFGKVW